MGGRGWQVFAGGSLALVVAYQLVPDDPWWRAGWQVGLGYLTVVVILVGVRRFPLADRLPWWGFAAGIGANATGIAVTTYLHGVRADQGFPSVADLCWLTLYPACAFGLAMLVRRRERDRNWAALVDVATITTGFALLVWVFVVEPAASDAAMPLTGRLVQTAYPVGDVVLLAMTARLLRGGGARGVAFWWVTGSLAAFLIGDATWALLGRFGVELAGAPVAVRGVESIFLVAYACFGVAALHRSAGELGAAGATAPRRLGALPLVTLAATALIAPVVLAAQAFAGTVTNGRAIAVGAAVMFILVLTRVAQLLRQVERQARTVRELSLRDELTGLPNRRGWNDELRRALERARRDGAAVTVAMLDLDNFKGYNDRHGHPAGDRLLEEATAAWNGVLRAGDVLARYGGEEFILLLPNVDTGRAVEVLRRALASTPLGQTFSAGVATWDGLEVSDDLIARADGALYVAKNAGRNQIITTDRPAFAR